jgi:hypothetical protein
MAIPRGCGSAGYGGRLRFQQIRRVPPLFKGSIVPATAEKDGRQKVLGKKALDRKL